MKKLCIYLIAIAASSFMIGMEIEEKHESNLAWVRTHDGKLTLVSREVINSSNLLKKASRQHEGSLFNPVTLPPVVKDNEYINKADLEQFIHTHKQTKKTDHKFMLEYQ